MLRGSCQLVRYAYDFVLAFEDDHSGRRMLDVLGQIVLVGMGLRSMK